MDAMLLYGRPDDNGCHADYAEYYDKVFVHFQQGIGGLGQVTSERWWWLGCGESYSPPQSGRSLSTARTRDCAPHCARLEPTRPLRYPALLLPATALLLTYVLNLTWQHDHRVFGG